MASTKTIGFKEIGFIFTAMLMLIFAVFTYVLYDEGQKIRRDLVTKTAEAGDEKKLQRDYSDQINELKSKVGYPNVASVGSTADTSRETVVGSMIDDIKTLGGPELQRDSYAETLRAMKQKVDNLQLENRNLTEKNRLLSVEYLAVMKSHYQDVASGHDARRKAAEGERDDANRTKETEIRNRDDQIVTLRGVNTNLQNNLKQTKDAHDKLKKDSESQIGRLEDINDFLTDAVRKRERITYDRPDGLVRWVDNDSGLVWINIGRDDKLTTRTQFSIYKQTHRGVGRPSAPANTADDEEASDAADERFSPGFEDIKGSIEVTRVIGAHLAEARILKYDIYDPIQPDDLIYTPLWAPGRPAAFAFVGLIDFDNDGASDRGEMHEMISGIGGQIIHEVLDDGRRVYYTEFPSKSHDFTEDDSTINLQMKYLVIGEIPDLSQAGSDLETQQFREIIGHHKKMVSEARETAVRRINLSDFLAHIGYVPHRRLFVPGLTDRPFTLKSGAASGAVGENIGDRASTGKVSGLFTRSKRLKKQPVSTGKTSGRFSKGN
jgi:hypothetical protein